MARWAGGCPGNTEAAGTRQRGQTTTGSKCWRPAVGEAAWAAPPTQGTSLRAKSQRLVNRRPKKKAVVAVAHTLRVSVYQLLSRRVGYAELGSDYVDRQQVERQRRRLVERLEAVGVKVPIEEVAEAA